MDKNPEQLPGNEVEPNLERQRIEEFRQTLNLINIVKPLEVEFDRNDEEPVTRAIERFKMYDLESTSGLYLAPNYKDEITSIEGFTPFMARGRRSAHGVFLGELHIHSGKVIPVAVKPHRVAQIFESCTKDYFSNAAIREFGFDTLEPVGMIIDHKRAYSMTLLEETLTTIDSIDWRNFLNSLEENPGMLETWQHIGRLLGTFHAMGSMMHGDLAARNIATTAEGAVLFIDWERARISLSSPRDAEIRYGYSYADLACLLDSMCLPTTHEFKAGIGLFYGHNVDWWESFCDLVFDEYCAYRLEIARLGNHHAAKEADVVNELEQLRRSLREDARIFQDALSNQ